MKKSTIRSATDLEKYIIANGPFSENENKRIYEEYFKLPPKRLILALHKYRLGEKKVLDLGCS